LGNLSSSPLNSHFKIPIARPVSPVVSHPREKSSVYFAFHGVRWTYDGVFQLSLSGHCCWPLETFFWHPCFSQKFGATLRVFSPFFPLFFFPLWFKLEISSGFAILVQFPPIMPCLLPVKKTVLHPPPHTFLFFFGSFFSYRSWWCNLVVLFFQRLDLTQTSGHVDRLILFGRIDDRTISRFTRPRGVFF